MEILKVGFVSGVAILIMICGVRYAKTGDRKMLSVGTILAFIELIALYFVYWVK